MAASHASSFKVFTTRTRPARRVHRPVASPDGTKSPESERASRPDPRDERTSEDQT